MLHVKDMAKGLTLPAGLERLRNDTNVAVGTGQVDWPSVFRAAGRRDGELYYIEDESTDPLAQLPKSLGYLEGLKL